MEKVERKKIIDVSMHKYFIEFMLVNEQRKYGQR